MSIRSGSKGTKDPAAANWYRVFGVGSGSGATLPAHAVEDCGSATTAINPVGTTPPSSPRPAELDPEDGA